MINSIMEKIGAFSAEWAPFMKPVVIVLLLAVLALVVYYFTRIVVSRIVMRVVRRSHYKWDDVFFNKRFFSRLGFLLASIVVSSVISADSWEVHKALTHLSGVLITIAAVLMLSEVLHAANRLYDTFSHSKDRPIKTVIQVAITLIWCAALVVILKIYRPHTNLWTIVVSMSAFTAVIILVFQNTILGFVAGIQLNTNNMVRIGDWIEMPLYGVNGSVTDITLTTVKVQNWDNTISTIPTHKLVSESFVNWRGMEESDGRRIKRSINIDVSTVHYLTEQEIATLRQSFLLGDYMDKKLEELDEFNKNCPTPLDQRRLTNLGTFREYLETTLQRNHSINLEMTHMVRQLQPGPTGLPLEIYCFSKLQAWVDYERVQADIFDHIYAVMPLFGLHAFQYSGSTVENS